MRVSPVAAKLCGIESAPVASAFASTDSAAGKIRRVVLLTLPGNERVRHLSLVALHLQRVERMALLGPFIEEDRVMESRPLVGLRARVRSPPDDFILKAPFAGYLVEHDLDVVRGVAVAVV